MENIEKMRTVKTTIAEKRDQYRKIRRNILKFKDLSWWNNHLDDYTPIPFLLKSPYFTNPCRDAFLENQEFTIGLLDGKVNEKCSYSSEFPHCIFHFNRKLFDDVLSKIPKHILHELMDDDPINEISAFFMEMPKFVDKLLTLAVDENDFTASCIAYYLLVENGIYNSFLVFIRKIERDTKNERFFEDFLDAINGKGEMAPVNVTPKFLKEMAFRTDKEEALLSLLSVRRYHLEHEEDYGKFTQQFLSSNIDDSLFLSETDDSSVSFSFSATEIRETAPLLASFVRFIAIVYGLSSAPENTISDDYHLLADLFPILQSEAALNYLRDSLYEKDPCLMHTLYWLIFDDGCLMLGGKIINELMKESNSKEEKENAQACLKALIECSYGNFCEKESWQKLVRTSPNPQVRNIAERFLKDVGHRRKQNAQYKLLEELIEKKVDKGILIQTLRHYFDKGAAKNSQTLACLFIALELLGYIGECPHYRVFHMALMEFYSSFRFISWDEPEDKVNYMRKWVKGKKNKNTDNMILTNTLKDMIKDLNNSMRKKPLPLDQIKDSLKEIFG